MRLGLGLLRLREIIPQTVKWAWFRVLRVLRAWSLELGFLRFRVSGTTFFEVGLWAFAFFELRVLKV